MTSQRTLEVGEEYKITGRYFFDMREGWSVLNVLSKPDDEELEECYMCGGSGKIFDYKGEHSYPCNVCKGTGKYVDKKWRIHPDTLADFVSSIVESGDTVEVTVKLLDRTPALLWDGRLEQKAKDL